MKLAAIIISDKFVFQLSFVFMLLPIHHRVATNQENCQEKIIQSCRKVKEKCILTQGKLQIFLKRKLFWKIEILAFFDLY